MRLRRTLMLSVIAGLLVSILGGCDRLPPDCRIGGADTGQLSTRTLFLERLNGCPVGGRD